MRVENNFNFYDYYHRGNESILLSYKGPFEKEVLGVIGNYIRTVIGKQQEAGRKIFAVFIELAQNIAHYSPISNSLSQEKESKESSLVIIEQETCFKVITGNCILNQDVIPLIERCEHINSLDNEQLREYKRKQLVSPDQDSGGGNIGLIKIALTSSNPIGFELYKIDEYNSLFTITIQIDKTKEIES